MGGGPPGPTSQSALPPCVRSAVGEGLTIIAIIDNTRVGHQSSAQPQTHSTRNPFLSAEARKSALIAPAAAVDDTARQTSGAAFPAILHRQTVDMRLSAVILALAASVNARNVIRRGGQSPLVEDDLAVPGQNPLKFCEADRDNDIIEIKEVILTPNPPEA